jgi:ComF family protein
MLDSALSLIAPHHCTACGEVGGLLCENCKYDIISESYDVCINCAKSLAASSGICRDCKVPYARAWCVADRRDNLEKLINGYKFANTHAAYNVLADLLHERLPQLPANTVIVPIPTVGSHVRQRGYDHMLLIAKRLAKLRNLPISADLKRATTTKQREASRSKRIAQAKVAFTVTKEFSPDITYLLIDDVVTTGSTMKYAAQKLLDAGAGAVWVATISRQPLD